MPTAEEEQEGIFEEAWLLAELAAASEDHHLAPLLFQLAEDMAVRPHLLRDEADDPLAPIRTCDLHSGSNDPMPSAGREQMAARRRLREAEERVSRQSSVVDRLELIGNPEFLALARSVLCVLEACLETKRLWLSLCEAQPSL